MYTMQQAVKSDRTTTKQRATAQQQEEHMFVFILYIVCSFIISMPIVA